MTMRTTRKVVTFRHPFLVEGVDRTLPAGQYEVITDEELIEGLSFPVFRRIATMMYVPAQSYPGSIEMMTIEPDALQAAQERDAEAAKEPAAKRC